MQGLSTSITGRALKQGKININAVDIRDFSEDKHRRVDDYPYGGGAGMLMQAQPVYDAWEHVTAAFAKEKKRAVRTVYVTPQGEVFNQNKAEEFAKAEELILLCGHYEGIDERVLEDIVTDYVSIGDYVLTGGELAAMVIVDAVARLVPGVLHNEESAQTESFFGNLLEYPQYSRPEVWHGKAVPSVLLSGNQKEIDSFRREQSVLRTRERRPDLFAAYQMLEDCKRRLQKQKLLHMDMIELINRGRAKPVSATEDELLLCDRVTGVFYHAGLSVDTCAPFQAQDLSFRVALHSREAAERLEKEFGEIREFRYCQMVYTRREKLPVRGLYRPDGRESASGLCIRQTDAKECAELFSESDMQLCGEKEKLFGAFLHGEIAGAAWADERGSLGMIYVRKKLRGQHIASALGTYMVNAALESGWMPYVQLRESDVELSAVWEKMGLFCAKEPVVWAECGKCGKCCKSQQ